jgi:hypothetical protein
LYISKLITVTKATAIYKKCFGEISMKKLLLAATVATLAMNAAQAAPTLYGKLNVTLTILTTTALKMKA